MMLDTVERRYIIFSALMVLTFGLIVIISSTAFSINLVSPASQIDPKTMATPGGSAYDGFAEAPENRVRELAPGQYEVYLIGYATKGWKWEPEEIRVPAGSEVTFYVTSGDVTHGLRVFDTNINVMVLPGYVSRITARFDEPRTYTFVCHEYCGILHHKMAGQIIVE